MDLQPFSDYFDEFEVRASPRWLARFSLDMPERLPIREFLDSGVVLALGQEVDLSIVAALAERRAAHVFVLLAKRTDLGRTALQDAFPGFSVEAQLDVDPEDMPFLQPLRGNAKLLVLRVTEAQGSHAEDPRRVALLLGRLDGSPAQFLTQEPRVRVRDLILNPGGFPMFPAKANLEAVLRWRHPPDRVLLPFPFKGPVHVDGPTDTPSRLVYQYHLEAVLEYPYVRIYGKYSRRRDPAEQGRRGARFEGEVSRRRPEESRAVKVENWEALGIGTGMRLFYQPAQTPLEGESLQRFLVAVQRAYAAEFLRLREGERPDREDIFPADAASSSAPVRARRWVDPEREAGSGMVVPYSQRMEEKVEQNRIIEKLLTLKLQLDARPELRDLKFSKPSALLPQEPIITSRLPGVDDALLTIKARISGRGVSLLLIPVDRSAAAKDRFRVLIGNEENVHAGGIHGLYSHCVRPADDEAGPKTRYFGYNEIQDIVEEIVSTIGRLQERTSAVAPSEAPVEG